MNASNADTPNTQASSLAKAMAGKFIVLDGPDGAGKSTQLRLYAEYLRSLGVAVRVVRDPGGTAIGDRIREILLDKLHNEMAVTTEMLLYMASRAQLVAEVIAPALSAGHCVLCDRYVSSTIAYQGAGGSDVRAIHTVADIAIGGHWPDLTVILDMDEAHGLNRVQEKRAALDRMESKGLKFHQKVRELFIQQAKADPARFAIVNAAGTIEQVHQRLRETIGHRFTG